MNINSFSQTYDCYISIFGQPFYPTAYRLNVSTCDTQGVGVSPSLDLYDIALTPSGNLYGIASGSSGANDLYKIDTVNGSLSYTGSFFTPTLQYCNALVDIDDNYLLATSGTGELCKVNISSMNVTYIGQPAFSSGGDLTFFKGYLYLDDGANGLYKIKLDANYSAVISSELVGTMNTPDMAVYGIVTIGTGDCEKNNFRMLAFEGVNVYEVNPDNAFCTLICDTVHSQTITGAASKAELISKDCSETNITIPNVFTPNGDGINDLFHIQGLDKKDVVQIYNRWGIPMAQFNGGKAGWDGYTTAGLKCSDGVYYYVVQRNNGEIIKGFVQLLN